ncbi:hypothetical protein [Isoalcanivorax beigongshangi]|uniref:Polyamine aminopropyltransferase n=1 Tax=Isoalcanivorax beigongshangi TaxID=3238810 RepID=A0ABV4AIV4_9GAMM
MNQQHFLFPTDGSVPPDRFLLERRRSEWQHIAIYQHPVYGNQLWIDDDLQISESDFAYNSAMVAPLLTLEHCQQVAILGGGDGGVLNYLLATWDQLQRPLARATLIDIDGAVIDLCRKWMPVQWGDAFDDPRAAVVVGDAFAWIEQARDLDAVIYDLTMDPVRDDLSQRQFIDQLFAHVRAALRPGGVFSLQACGEWDPDSSALLATLRERLGAMFGEVREQTVMVPSYGELWTFISVQAD